MAMIRFMPNDPVASAAAPLREIEAPRLATQGATFDISDPAPPGLYAQGTPAFDHWQVCAALVAGQRTWRTLGGGVLPTWFGGLPSLTVETNAGDDLNAFYDRSALRFFTHAYRGTTVRACESVDVVCHEQGHAFLDAIRPDFFDVPCLEAAAFHEAFGDCMALLVALGDPLVCRSILARAPTLRTHHFAERFAEEIGAAIAREFGASRVERGALRRALNGFAWADPATLPLRAPAKELSAEPHSFSRVFTGAIYDLVRALFLAGPRTTPGLGLAARAAGAWLVRAVRSVPLGPRVYAAVGKRMMEAAIADRRETDAARIRAAFGGHGIRLPAPARSLPMPTPGGSKLATVVRRLKREIGDGPGDRVGVTRVAHSAHGTIAHVSVGRPHHIRDPRLRGATVFIPSTARLQLIDDRVVGLIGDPVVVDDAMVAAADSFVTMLLDHDEIGGALPRLPTCAREMPRPSRTHLLAVQRGVRTVERRGFA